MDYIDLVRLFRLAHPERRISGSIRRVFLVTAVLCSCLSLLPASGFGTTPIYVTASFVDDEGFYINDLQQDEVTILEDGQPRPIKFMAGQELPAVYGLIFDRSLLDAPGESDRISGRDRPRISEATAAKNMAYELIDKYLGQHPVWVGAYDKELTVVLEPVRDRFRTKESIQRLQGTKEGAESFLYGALFSAIKKMSQRSERRRVLIVFVETMDLESSRRREPLRNLLAASNVETLFVGFGSKLGSSSGPGLRNRMLQPFLAELGRESAGETLFLSDYGGNLDDIVRRLIRQLQTMYTFGFESESSMEKPAELAIKCSRKGCKVKSRSRVPVSQ